MTEPEVVQKTHRFLCSERLWERRVLRLFTDAHHTLLPFNDLRPFQRFTLDVGDFVVYPDLVGQIDDGETIFAIEAKGTDDLLKRLAQAELYQVGFHHSFLAADAGVIGATLERLARQKNVGLLAVGEEVHVAHLPEARLPWREPFRAIARQMETVVQVSGQQTFQYNLPTHYLAWTLALEPGRGYAFADLPRLVDGYPMPRGWEAAWRGAQKLGLVQDYHDTACLSPVGSAVRDVLRMPLEAWAGVHHQVGRRGSPLSLVDVQPQAAAVLRLLLLRDPMVRLVIDGLEHCPGHQASFDQLARVCDSLDHARAPIFFFNPETIEEITDDRGHVLWDRLEGRHYRSRMFYQHKSILKHAGSLADTGLGGAASRTYEPEGDLWKLH